MRFSQLTGVASRTRPTPAERCMILSLGNTESRHLLRHTEAAVWSILYGLINRFWGLVLDKRVTSGYILTQAQRCFLDVKGSIMSARKTCCILRCSAGISGYVSWRAVMSNPCQDPQSLLQHDLRASVLSARFLPFGLYLLPWLHQ